MTLEAYSGSEELTDEQINDINSSVERLEAEVFKSIEAGDAMKAFLNTVPGKSIRSKIAQLEFDAMRLSATGETEEDRDIARYRYDVLQSVKSVFGIIIVEGVEALKLASMKRGASDAQNH